MHDSLQSDNRSQVMSLVRVDWKLVLSACSADTTRQKLELLCEKSEDRCRSDERSSNHVLSTACGKLAQTRLISTHEGPVQIKNKKRGTEHNNGKKTMESEASLRSPTLCMSVLRACPSRCLAICAVLSSCTTQSLCCLAKLSGTCIDHSFFAIPTAGVILLEGHHSRND